MEQLKNYTSGSTQGVPILDVKPLRSLSPMFPPTFGFTLHASSGTPPFVCVSPFGTPASQQQPGQSSNGNAFIAGLSKSPIQTPLSLSTSLKEYAGMCDGVIMTGERTAKQKSDSSVAEGSQKKKKHRTKYAKVLDLALSDDPREAVEVVLMTYDALRRRLMQLDEANNATKVANLKAGTIMTDNELRTNAVKRIGSLPGVNVGDIFFFRVEMCLIGLHAPSMAGIDFLTTMFGDESDTVAISIVSSGLYEDEDNDVDVLIYTGQGGSKGNGKKTQVNDQKLERGNLALERSLHRGNQIRVIRGAKDWGVQSGKIYFYDGLYKVHESWIEKGKTGFNIFKYKLLREPGQQDGFAVWKMIEKWKKNPSSRGNIILSDISSGLESVPLCLVNEVDDEKGPRPFLYAIKPHNMKPINTRSLVHGCTCTNVCLPTDGSCYCSQQNGGDLSYSMLGSLVRRMPLIHECNFSCKCSPNCRNRVAQKGIKLCLEVFKTIDRGWGVRSWEPIRAGTFICEFIGDVIDTNQAEQDGEEDSYIFDPNAVNKSFRWNYGPELLGEPSLDENPKPLPFVVTAKRIGNVSRFMNHSCSPNVFWQPVQYDHGDENTPHIMFYAMKHIPPMTELTYDYGQGGHRKKDCLCGSQNCRGVFG